MQRSVSRTKKVLSANCQRTFSELLKQNIAYTQHRRLVRQMNVVMDEIHCVLPLRFGCTCETVVIMSTLFREFAYRPMRY
jgi:hypothetical protein